MNLNLIYEGKNYQFDIPKDVTINYIKEIASKIFHYEDKGLQLFFKDNNLNNFNDKKFVNQLLKDNEKNITIHLEKKNISNKSNNILSNESTVDTNNHNDKYYKELKNKFKKIHMNYNKKINYLSNFKEKIHEIFDKLIIILKTLRNSILKIDNILINFYKNKNYDKLIKLFEENKQGYVFTEKDLKRINEEIQTLIDDYKYIITQNNYQININNFIELEIRKIKDFNKQFENIQNNNNYDEFIHELDKIFDFSYIKIQNNNIEQVESNDSNLLNNSFDFFQKEKQIFELPKIEKSNSKEKTINHFAKTNSNKISKKIKLIKENENKNIISINKKIIHNFLPEINSKIDDKNLFDLKLFKTSHSKFHKKQNNEYSLVNQTSSHIIDKLLNKTSNKLIHKCNNINDLNITKNDIKPKIMEKSEEKKMSYLHNENKNWNLNLKNLNQSKNKTLLIHINKDNSIIKSPSKKDKNENKINDNSFKFKTPSKTDRNEHHKNDNSFKFKSPSKHRNEININNNTIHNSENHSPNKNVNLSISILSNSKNKKVIKKISNKSLVNHQKDIKHNKNEKDKDKEKSIQFKLENQNENKDERPKCRCHTTICHHKLSSPTKSKSNKTVVKILIDEILKDENLNSLSPSKKKRNNTLKTFIKNNSIKSVKLNEDDNIEELFENFHKKHQKNSKDEIQKLVKDLLHNSPNNNKSNNKKEEILIKKNLTDSKINAQKNYDNKIENSNNDCISEIIDNEGKKKKKKLFNKFDFII